MKYLIFVLFFLIFTIQTFASIYIIPDNYSSIQEAINAASKGDTLVVKPGIYKEKIEIKDKNLFITSKFFLAHNKKYITGTIINGEGKYAVVSFVNCPAGTIFSGFSIINGYAKQGGGISIKNSEVSLENINVIQNSAELKGGGIYISQSKINIIDSKISKNSVIGIGSGGGGIFAERASLTMVNSEISENMAFLGGGIYALNTEIQLSNLNVLKNNAESKAGGIYLIGCKDPVLKNLNIEENYAYKTGGIGGGICIDTSDPIIVNTRIHKNLAYKAAGVYLTLSNPKFLNCLIDNNKAKDNASSILIYHSKPILQNVTIVDNNSKNASNISCNSMSKIKIINSILWNNGETEIKTDYTSDYDISYTLIKGNYHGTYVYDKEPIFLNYKAKDYHLTKTSFGINKGNPKKKYNDTDGTRNDLGCYGGKLGNW